MFLIYSLLVTFGVIVMAPCYVWRRGGVGSMAGWKERFGLPPPALGEIEPGGIWVHAVSVGETLAVVGLVREIQQYYTDRKVYLSHVTPAGREAGEVRLPGVAARFYLPLDWRWSVRRVLRRLRPALLLIAETELWPNLLRSAHEFDARVILVNARVSDRSLRGYRWVRPFMRRVLENVDRVCAQTAKDADRFRMLGAPVERVVVTGNLKFDSVPGHIAASSRLKAALSSAGRSPVIIAASTMPGEEELILPAWKRVRDRHARALMVLAPRHPARFDAVAQLLASRKIDFTRRTGLPSDEAAMAALTSPEVLILDTIGELAGILELADIVFIGGSLVPTGGHNLLEPAYWGKSIVFGPHMENFADIAQLFLEAGAATQVQDDQDLARMLLELLDDEPRRRELGERARQTTERESGATQRILAIINNALNEAAPLPARAR